MNPVLPLALALTTAVFVLNCGKQSSPDNNGVHAGRTDGAINAECSSQQNTASKESAAFVAATDTDGATRYYIRDNRNSPVTIKDLDLFNTVDDLAAAMCTKYSNVLVFNGFAPEPSLSSLSFRDLTSEEIKEIKNKLRK